MSAPAPSDPSPEYANHLEHVYSRAQHGLLHTSRHAVFVTLTFRDEVHTPEGREEVLDAVRKLLLGAEEMDGDVRALAAFSERLWQGWTESVPPGAPVDSILARNEHFRDTQADAFFYLKADRLEACEELFEGLVSLLGDALAEEPRVTPASMPADGKVLDRHFPDGLTSVSDPAQVVGSILLDGPADHAGGSWAFVQKFAVDWSRFAALSTDNKDDVIGRTRDGVIIPDDDRRSHIQRARVYNNARENLKMIRQAMPFGRSPSGAGREVGIYFVAYAADTAAVEQVLRSMAGHGHGGTTDHLLDNVQGVGGGYYYIPSVDELGGAEGLTEDDFVTAPHWAVRSSNGWMYYNSNDYLTRMGAGDYPDPPSQRILHLIGNAFSLWRDHWYQPRTIPEIPHLSTFLPESERDILDAHVSVRKGKAIQLSLTQVHTNSHYPQSPDDYAWQADQFRIDPLDVLFGVMPELSLGRGKEVMPYLREDEHAMAFSLLLDESSAMGHIVPDHARLLRLGLGGLIDEVRAHEAAHPDASTADFYRSARLALEGVQGLLRNYARLATRMADDADAGYTDAETANLRRIAARAERLASQPPAGFHDAVQLVFTMHMCFHLTGNPVSVGRFDQLLAGFYEADGISFDEAQEIVDAFWVKLGEKALHNRHYVGDHVSYGTTAVSYIGGNFPQGGGINQWVQQLTVGGYLPTDAVEPQPAANAVTLMALRASRRLPLNAPCLSLRLYPGIGQDIVDEAAKSLLSGGAHPILFQEDRMVGGLHEYTGIPLADARDYASDGCYEPMVAGKTEFCFSNVTPLDALECALNQGAKLSGSGPVYLRGLKASFRSPHAADITSFEQLQEIFLEHLRWFIRQFFLGTLGNYGNLWKVCPSPMLSTLIGGCLESGHDLTDGGARYHFIAPMFVGMATTIDSLYAVKALCFDDDTAVCTLPELVDCLRNDWGHAMQEPSQSRFDGETRLAVRAKQYMQWRERALTLPKFGNGHDGVDELGAWLSGAMCDAAMDILHAESGPVHDLMARLKETYSTDGRDWKMHLCPGIGTFEGYVGDGAGSAASADGRRSAQPYPSDFSPAPIPQDLPPVPQQLDVPTAVPGAYREIYQAMRSWDTPEIYHKLSNASPVDLNIREDFPLEDLQRVIRDYADGRLGSNLLTVTCVDPDTYAAAAEAPEKYELVRVRMGGWTEYFAVMFPAHQAQHRRRPYFVQ